MGVGGDGQGLLPRPTCAPFRSLEAHPLCIQCLEKRKSILGENHPFTLNSMNSLAVLYKNQGQYDKVRPLYKECLEKKKSILGENHPNTLKLMNSLAALYDMQGQYDQARSLCKNGQRNV